MENTQQSTEVSIQVELAIIQFKIQLLALAKDMVKEGQTENVIETYLDLREEVLGRPNLKIKKKMEQKIKTLGENRLESKGLLSENSVNYINTIKNRKR